MTRPRQNPFSLHPSEPVLLEHWCVCLRCGDVRGPLRYIASPDGISRMHGCDSCDPLDETIWREAVSNVGDFLGAGLRAVCR